MQPLWTGTFPAMTTHLYRDQSLDLDATARHIEIMIDSGVSGLVMLGSLGENAALDPDEKRSVMEMAVGVARGRVPVLSGISETSTSAACRYAKDVAKLGGDGLMVLPAMVYKSDPAETLLHYRTVAGATDLPIICYNNPIAYGVDITPEMFVQLSDVDTLVAIKESSGNTCRITDIIKLLGDRYTIFTGVDDLALESIMLGAKGWIAGIGLAFPQENQYLWDLTERGDWDKAREIYRWYMPLLHLDVSLKFVQNIKLAIQECGLGSEWVRAPRQPLAGTERAMVLKVIKQGLETRPVLPELAVASR